MKKKILSLMLSVVFLLSMATVSYADSFSDVTKSFSWAEEAITKLSEDGVISGYPDGTFKPGQNITHEEAVTLLAKAIGYNENESIVSYANDTYAADLESFTSYAVSQAAYLLYKGVLYDEDITLYMATASKGQALKRYEAATLIARALGADIWLSENPDYDITFSDADKIPSDALAYVYYVNDKGIMTGMEDNKFEPNTNVTRAQIAVMINRIRNTMDFSYESGVVASLESALNTVTFKDNNGKVSSYNISDSVIVTINGELSDIKDLAIGTEVIITKSNGAIYALDSIIIIPDSTIEGIFKGKLTDSKKTVVKIADMENEKLTEYTVSPNVVVTYEGTKSSIAKLVVNDHVTAEIKGGEVVFIAGSPKNVSKEGLIVEGIEFYPDVTIKLKDTKGIVESYGLKSTAKLKRNGDDVDFSELSIGDKVNITTDYGLIATVVAYGVDKTVEGSIREIIISKDTSYISVDTGSDVLKYTLSRDAKFYINGEEGTIYDLRLGDQAEFDATSSTITSVSVKSVATQTQITGVVTLVNNAYGMIVVNTTDAHGNKAEQQIFVKSTAKILDSTDGKVKSVKDIKPGQNIMAAGVVNMGIFEATSIMILVG